MKNFAKQHATFFVKIDALALFTICAVRSAKMCIANYPPDLGKQYAAGIGIGDFNVNSSILIARFAGDLKPLRPASEFTSSVGCLAGISGYTRPMF